MIPPKNFKDFLIKLPGYIFVIVMVFCFGFVVLIGIPLAIVGAIFGL